MLFDAGLPQEFAGLGVDCKGVASRIAKVCGPAVSAPADADRSAYTKTADEDASAHYGRLCKGPMSPGNPKAHFTFRCGTSAGASRAMSPDWKRLCERSTPQPFQ
jgi:hypothetical protein